jgi:hypothetical protein
MPLDKSTIVRPVVRKETVPAESLGGEVIVRQLTLSEMLALGTRAREGASQDDEIAQVLAWCAIDPKGDALMTLDEWQAWGAGNLGEAFKLYEVAIRLTGLEKKTTPTA